MSAVLNKIKPQVLQSLEGIDWSNVPVQMHKYRKFKSCHGLDLPHQALKVLDEMFKYLTLQYKSIYFDFKVYDLKEGDCGCALPEWHIDVTPNPNHPTKECRHLIYTTEIGTEFLLNVIHVDERVTDFRHSYTNQLKQVEELGFENTLQVPPDVISLYYRSNVHRAPIMTRDCKRVMIRLTETDVF